MKIILAGPPGVGKSSVGNKLSISYDIPFFDIDSIIKEEIGVTYQNFGDFVEQKGFKRLEELSDNILATLIDSDINRCVISTSGNPFSKEKNRELLKVSREKSTQIRVVFLHASIRSNILRVLNDANNLMDRFPRKLCDSLDGIEIISGRIAGKSKEAEESLGKIADFRIDADGSINTVTHQVACLCNVIAA